MEPDPPNLCDGDVPVDAVAMVFDTETSDFAGVVIQLGVVFLDASGAECATYNKLWRIDDGVALNPRAVAVHRIGRDRLDAEGVEPRAELEWFARLVRDASARGCRLVAHNARFDAARLNHTAARHGIAPVVREEDVLCTMARGKWHCNLRRSDGRPKLPKNDELFRCLVGQAPDGELHDALTDARVTARCYTEGKARGWWP